MILITTWKSRPLNPEQFNRLMNVWGKLEQKTAADSSTERICWYSYSDGCLLYTSPSPRDGLLSRMPSSA